MTRYIYYYDFNGYIVKDIVLGKQLTHQMPKADSRKCAANLNEADRKYRSVTKMIGAKYVKVGGRDQ